MEKMLVTEALNELKLLDARILKAIHSNDFVTSAKKNDDKLSNGVMKEAFVKGAESGLQSINSLIKRRETIKAAIVDSNAKTLVKIDNLSMPVAAAIEKKSSIRYEQELLSVLQEQYANAKYTIAMKNAEIEQRIDALVTTALGKENKTNNKSSEDYIAISEPYRTRNECALVGLADIANEIAKREASIEGFLSEVDSKLQISNCTTEIEF